MTTINTFQDWQEKQNSPEAASNLLFLTESQVQSFAHLKDATSEEIENIILTLHDLALISYHLFCQEIRDNKPVVSLG
jgi:hypothetical protein